MKQQNLTGPMERLKKHTEKLEKSPEPKECNHCSHLKLKDMRIPMAKMNKLFLREYEAAKFEHFR
jgi:hypothetical protein